MEDMEQQVESGGGQPNENHQGDPGQPFQSASQDWRANLPPDLQPAMARFRDPAALAKSYVESLNLIGKKIDQFSDVDRERYAALASPGVPQNPNDYKLDLTDGLDGAIPIDPEAEATAKEIFHWAGLSNDQAQKMCHVMNAIDSETRYQESMEQESFVIENMNNLARDWGNAYEGKLRSVNNCIESLLPNLLRVSSGEIKEAIEASGAQYNSLFMNLLANLGELVSESPSAGLSALGPRDAASQLDILKKDPDFKAAFINPSHPMHSQHVEQFRTLSRMKHNEQ
jgi:hypothetical protein